MRKFSIGELARQAGVGVETVRYYQRKGLLPKPPQPARGYREYAPEILAQLRFIRKAKGLGFKLREIANLLAFRRSGRCSELRVLLVEKVADLEFQALETELKKRAVEELVDACSGKGLAADCSVFELLDTPLR